MKTKKKKVKMNELWIIAKKSGPDFPEVDSDLLEKSLLGFRIVPLRPT